MASLLVTPQLASAATFEVNSTADTADLDGNIATAGPFDGVCDVDAGTTGDQCTLRAALAEAQATVTADQVRFDEASTFSQTITVVDTFPPMTRSVDINGCLDPTEGDGGSPSSTQPCVGLRWDNAGTGLGTALNFNAGDADVVIRGIAFTRWSGAIRFSDLTVGLSSLEVQNNWFGTQVDGTTQEAVGGGVFVAGDNATIGGDENGAGQTERNVFSNNTGTAIQIGSADNSEVQGNFFGTTPSGTAASSPGNGENIEIIRTLAPADDVPNNNTIGGTVTPAQHATAGCDGVCNVIAGANGAMSGYGIDLQGESALSESEAGQTTIAGNHIGLLANGTAALGNLIGVRVGNANGVTIGGAASEARNYITGGGAGVTTLGQGSGNDALRIENNFIGLQSDGVAALAAPSTGLLINVPANAALPTPPVISGNRIATPTSGDYGISLSGGNAAGGAITVSGNTIGLGVGAPAPDVGGGNTSLRIVLATNVNVTGNVIGNSSTTGLALDGAQDIEVLGNLIGTDATGANHGHDAQGIRILAFGPTASTGNVIGGVDSSQENVISNSGGDAISIQDDTSDDNELRVNRGSGNAGLFIELGNDGPDPAVPAHDVNEGTPPPDLTSVAHDNATGTAAPGAVVRVFRKATASPGEVAAFLGQATADGSGTWQLAYPSLPGGTLVTATQTVGTPIGSTSELAAPLASTAPPSTPDPPTGGGGDTPAPPGADVNPPDTAIASGPKDKTKSKTATFEFSASDARVVAGYQCSLDGGAFTTCTSPFAVKVKKGRHRFEVRAVDAAGNVDPTPASDTWKVKKKRR